MEQLQETKYQMEYRLSRKSRYYWSWVVTMIVSFGIYVFFSFAYVQDKVNMFFPLIPIMLFVFSVLKMFFVGAGKLEPFRKRTNASQCLFITILYGAFLVLMTFSFYAYQTTNQIEDAIRDNNYLLAYLYSRTNQPSEHEIMFILTILIVVWIVAVAVAIINKVLVNNSNKIK